MTAKAVALAVAAAIAWALKQHYAGAGADDLWWILTPTAELVGVATGVEFTPQPGEGYFSRERMFLIEKSCAGMNFMVAAFVMLVFTWLHRIGDGLSVLRVLGLSVAGSYAAAVTTNAIRIAIAIALAGQPAALRPLSAADIHRLEGVVVYFGGLVLLYDIAQRVDRRGWPFAWSSSSGVRRVEVAG